MADKSPIFNQDVMRFILERIDSVPHLEALLLIWNSRPKPWSVNDLAQRLYVSPNIALSLLRNLTAKGLIAYDSGADTYLYDSKSDENNRIVEATCSQYRLDIVAVSTMIHQKASAPVRNFADAFRFKKERE